MPRYIIIPNSHLTSLLCTTYTNIFNFYMEN
jgi:hypothetical protein